MIRSKSIPSYKPIDTEGIMEAKLLKLFDIGFRANKENLHLSRKKFIIHYIKAMLICKDVRGSEIADWLNDDVKSESNERRIKRFYNEVEIDYFQIACILLCLLPTRGKLTICIDRTNWEFGDLSINVLAATVYCKGVGVPLFFELLDNNGGNSNTMQRKCLIRKILRLIPVKRVECVIADREFVGFDWWQYLIKKKITFFIRCKQDTNIIRDEKKRKAMNWSYAIRTRTFKDIHIEDVKSGNQICCNVAIKRIGYKVKGDNYLIVLTNANPKLALEMYEKRWSIEVFFQSIKGRGFQLEKTQLKILKYIKKLFALVSIAFAICFATGVWKDENQESIPIKKHGYKAYSFFKYGFKELFKILKNTEKRRTELFIFCDLIIRIVTESVCFWKEQKTHILLKKSFVT